MPKNAWPWLVAGVLAASPILVKGGGPRAALKPEFLTSDRCLACHNSLLTPSGRDVSIGLDWRASIMANSGRDPYWQGSVRRESLDHPESQAAIEDECSTCHMPITRYEAKVRDRKGEVFAHLPFNHDKAAGMKAADGVSCSVCHQISKEKLGTRESFSGNFVVAAPASADNHPEFGPFVIQPGQTLIMDSSTGGFRPTPADHIRDSAMCGSCHTLITKTLGAGGKELGTFPEQMPYQEWLHSDYRDQSSCQTCHMPEVSEPAPISAVLGINRTGVHQHTFVGGNFFMLKMLNAYRDDLSVAALPQELTRAAEDTIAFLQSHAARVRIENLNVAARRLEIQVLVQNLTGHKLPTAYPSRRAWLHVVVRDRYGHAVFESGALNSDGSIEGNDNDVDGARYEPHYSRIERGDQVQIYEPILKDQNGHVTTGLLSAVGYLKDNRLLPTGFQKQTADAEIAVVGDAFADPNFSDGGDRIEYSVALGTAEGPFHVEAELWYQPIGFRWAHNLAPYTVLEPQRFVGYFDSMASSTAVLLAHAEATR